MPLTYFMSRLFPSNLQEDEEGSDVFLHPQNLPSGGVKRGGGGQLPLSAGTLGPVCVIPLIKSSSLVPVGSRDCMKTI